MVLGTRMRLVTDVSGSQALREEVLVPLDPEPGQFRSTGGRDASSVASSASVGELLEHPE